MAHNHVHEFHPSEGLLSGLGKERLWIGRKRRAWSTNSTQVESILQLKLGLITLAAMAWGCIAITLTSTDFATTNFAFDGNFSQNSFIVVQDASVEAQKIDLNSGGVYWNKSSSGRALYSTAVQLLAPASNSVASFQTSFSFSISARENSSKGNGFAFGFFPDNTSVGDPGKFMGVLPSLVANSTSNNSTMKQVWSADFNHTFVVEFDTHQDDEFRDPSDNHVGVNWNSMESLNATDLTTAALGLDLVGGNITAWIYYSYPSLTLSVWVTTSATNFDPKVHQPVLEVGDLDLSQLLLPSMYVGFAGGNRNGDNELHTISSWTFASTFGRGLNSVAVDNDSAPTVSVAVGKSCDGNCTTERRTEMILIGCLVFMVFCFVVGSICFLFLIRRRCGKAAEPPDSMLQKLDSSTPESSRPLQEQKLRAEPRDSKMGPRPSAPSRAILSSKPAYTRLAQMRSSKLMNYSPRSSASPKAFSPARASLKPFSPFLEPTRFKQHRRNSSAGAGSTRFTTTQELDLVSSFGPRRYTYREIKHATDGFKETLGEGGFGTVFKGYLFDKNGDRSIPVAVKQLAGDSKQGEREFLAEVSIIAGLRHRNLVPMQGWCHEKDKLLLIYDYMENSSLNKHLYGTNRGDPVFPWNLRYKAVCQVASALMYLHEEAEQKVIHRDIKSSNVLLDAKFNARLGDFGLARLSEHSQVADTTVMAGTMGYLAPELVYTGKATTMTDVFSFGTLLLEVVCGKKPLDCRRPPERQLLGDWVWEQFEAGRLLDAVDRRLLSDMLDMSDLSEMAEREQHDEKEMTRALQVGLMCLHPHADCRPPIRFVRQMLLGDLALPTLPNRKPTMFGSGPVSMPLKDILGSSLTSIANAIERPYTKTRSLKGQNSDCSAEFEAPWKLKISRDEYQTHPPRISYDSAADWSSNSFGGNCRLQQTHSRWGDRDDEDLASRDVFSYSRERQELGI